MLLYAGIDEAGYGPMFGPLTIGCTAFRLADHDPADGPPDMWELLRRAVCRSRRDRAHRVAVDDSKKLKNPPEGTVHPLKHLERGVLAFHLARGHSAPPDDVALLGALEVPAPNAAWYASRTNLPIAQTTDELRIAGATLDRAMRQADVSCELISADAIDAGEFNEQVGKMGSKAAVSFCSVMRLVDKVWKRWPDDHPRIIVDRQSGRTQYLRPLQMCYPDAMIRVICEEETISRYELDDAGRRLTISFVTEAEGRHFPVALASMTAKYLRELLMLRLNRFFTGHLPELKPTAGYVLDGRRYLAEIEPLIERLGLPRRELIRTV